VPVQPDPERVAQSLLTALQELPANNILAPGWPQIFTLMMGDAYADVVALADGGGYDPSESEKYVEAPSARLKAIDEYRLSIRDRGLDTSSTSRRDRSIRATDLLPVFVRVRFLCFRPGDP
jgi:hypothetical protein